MPVGLGAPIYSKLDTDIAAALMSIKCSKGSKYWSRYERSVFKAKENPDEMSKSLGQVKFKTNQAGGFLGGISSGQNIIASFAVKTYIFNFNKSKTIDKKR